MSKLNYGKNSDYDVWYGLYYYYYYDAPQKVGFEEDILSTVVPNYSKSLDHRYSLFIYALDP